MMRDDDSKKLLMKILQESLRDGYRQFELIVTTCKVWLSWEEKLSKFWDNSSGCRRARQVCSVHF